MLVSSALRFPGPISDLHYWVCCCLSSPTCMFHPSPGSEPILTENRLSSLLPTPSIQDRFRLCDIHRFSIKKRRQGWPQASAWFPNTPSSPTPYPRPCISFPEQLHFHVRDSAFVPTNLSSSSPGFPNLVTVDTWKISGSSCKKVNSFIFQPLSVDGLSHTSLCCYFSKWTCINLGSIKTQKPHSNVKQGPFNIKSYQTMIEE